MWNKDLVTRFVEYTKGQKSPEIFRQWTAISMIAGCLERRVWSESLEEKPAYPNLYILLVGRPGRGKEVIQLGENMLRELTGGQYSAAYAGGQHSKIQIGSHDITSASLIDEVNAAQISRPMPNGKIEQYACLSGFAEELGVFLKSYDNTFITTLTKLWNNVPSYQQTRRTGGLSIDIKNPSFNLLIGGTPGALGDVLPEVAWSMGFMGRMLMVYSDQEIKVKYFTSTSQAEKDKRKAMRKDILDDLFHLTALRGRFIWDDEAIQALQLWDDHGCQPRPKHSKLEDYCSRRTFFTIKLTMIAAISARGELHIKVEDFLTAKDWLLEIEEQMPDVFRAMVGRSDKDLIEEAHSFAWQMYAKQGNKPMPISVLVKFISSRAPNDKVKGIIETMATGDFITLYLEEDEENPGRKVPFQFVPLPATGFFGIE